MSGVLYLRQRQVEGQVILCSPTVGRWHFLLSEGGLISPGQTVGFVDQLGVRYKTCVPDHVHGLIVEHLGAQRRAVGFGEALLAVDPSANPQPQAAAEETKTHGLVVPAPMSGRFYLRASPDQPPFVQEGDAIQEGAPVGLLEVMKTFNRVHYGGKGLPTSARVKRILKADGEDVTSGEALLEVEEN